MPDTRSHRGLHPEDPALFAPDQLPALQRATVDLCWLLDHGYAIRSSLALVGDRYRLAERQRLAIARCVCAVADRDRRVAHEIPVGELAEHPLWIDGYNLLISVEAALGGGIILQARDGCFRDLASLHGTYRTVAETTPAVECIGEELQRWNVSAAHWLLDRPVSNSGRLKEHLLEIAGRRGWTWEVELEFSPDHRLAATSGVVATSDSMVLDRCARWANVSREIITRRVPGAFVVDLHGPDSPTAGRLITYQI